MSLRRSVDLLLVAVLGALGGLGFMAAFAQDDLLRPVGVAAVAAVLVSAVVTGAGRQGVTITLLVAVPVLGAAAVAGCGLSPGELVGALTDGPRTILTSTVPAPGEPELLVVPYAVAALATLLGAELAQRSRLAVAPALPPLVGLVVGLAFGGDGRFPPLWLPGAWVLAAAVLTGWRSGGIDADAEIPVVRGAHSRGASRLLRPPSVRAVATVLLVAVPLAGCARWLGPRLPGAEDRDRFDLRGLVDQPAQAQQVDNPLVGVTAWQDGPDDELFVADTSERVDRWRLAVLDSYDGIEWRSAAGFLTAGNELPPPVLSDDGDEDLSGDTADSTEVTETVSPTGLGGRWLPVVDRAVEVSLPGTLFDRSGGVLLVEGAELPDSYTVRSEVPQLDPEQMVSAAAADDDEARAALVLPENLPPDVEALADEITKGTGAAYGKAAAIERYLAATPGQAYELATEDLPSGHSVGHIRCFLFAPDQCARRGSTEQFVATFALLARTAGLPTRVVVGFQATGGPGRAAVSAHDATAWAEVKFEGLGWVAFDPVPDPNVEITPPTTGVAGATATSAPTPPTTVGDVDDTVPPVPDEPASQAASDDGRALQIVGAVVLVAGLVLGFPALWRARRRRRRQRARTAEGRVAGAWAAALDELSAAGAVVTRAMAVADVVSVGRTQLGTAAEALDPLGALVNRTHFAPAGAHEGADREAWSLSDRFRKERRAGRPLVRRLREYLTVRSPA